MPIPPSSSPRARRLSMSETSVSLATFSTQRRSRMARPNASSEDSSLEPVIAPMRAKAQFAEAP